MSVYLSQYRALNLKSGVLPTKFPARVAATITFAPEDAFGVQTLGGRSTAPKGRPCGMIWNANEGTSQWQGEFIDKISADFRHENLEATLDGNKLLLRFEALSLEDTHKFIDSANHFLPALLSFHLRVFVWIKKFEVEVRDTRFNFEIQRSTYSITIATKEHNTSQVLTALNEWYKADKSYLKILSAFYYYRHAKRLAIMEPNPESMVAEVILNLTKAVELIFSDSRKVIRARAREWGFPEAFIEERIIPLFLVRNELGIAHVTSAPFNLKQRQIIINFTHIAFSAVRNLLERVSRLVLEGKIKLQSPSKQVEKDKEKLLKDIERYNKRKIES